MSSPDGTANPATLPVDVQVIEGIHVGPATDSCVRPGPSQPVTACDFVGLDGLAAAMSSVGAESTHVMIYDNGGQLAQYRGPIDVPDEVHLSAAGGVDPTQVEVYCVQHNAEWFNLVGANVWLRNFSFVARGGCFFGIRDIAGLGGHRLENLRIFGSRPEVNGANTLVFPAVLGPDSTILNSHIYGHFESQIPLGDRSQLLGNTFVWFQYGGSTDLRASQGMRIENNVFVSLSRRQANLFIADATTTGLSIQGNVVEGFDQLIVGLSGADPSNQVQNNSLALAQLESPMVPRFLSDSSQRSTTISQGMSLDGLVTEGQSDLRPGAFQIDSSQTQPRRTTVRVGGLQGCGGLPCDIQKSEDNEIQRAVWSSWPGGTVEIYPSLTPYAGNAVVTWGLSLRGMGAGPDDVILESKDEDTVLTDHRVWIFGLISRTKTTLDPLRVENMTLRVNADLSTDRHAIYIESGGADSTVGLNELKRLKITSLGGSPGLQSAFYVGHNTLMQDILIQGEFGTCARFGTLTDGGDDTALPSTVHVVNMSCRLIDTPAHPTLAVFQVAATEGSQFANLAVEVDVPVPFFQAQLRGAELGPDSSDPPLSFTATAISSKGHDPILFGSFDAGDGTYTVTVDTALDPFFVGPLDSRLDSPLFHPGIDPLTLSPAITSSVSINGVDRRTPLGPSIDRGAYEQ